MIPQNYIEWKDCIENKCKIKIDSQFIDNRIKVYKDPENEETKKFVTLYGESYLSNVIFWLEKAKNEVSV
jgi:hypothetical protein